MKRLIKGISLVLVFAILFHFTAFQYGTGLVSKVFAKDQNATRPIQSVNSSITESIKNIRNLGIMYITTLALIPTPTPTPTHKPTPVTTAICVPTPTPTPTPTHKPTPVTTAICVPTPMPTPTHKPTPVTTAICVPTPTPTSSVEILYGDLNNDNNVNSTDVTYMKRFLLGRLNTLPNPEVADVNQDGKINSTDLTILRRYILRRISSLPI